MHPRRRICSKSCQRYYLDLSLRNHTDMDFVFRKELVAKYQAELEAKRTK